MLPGCEGLVCGVVTFETARALLEDEGMEVCVEAGNNYVLAGLLVWRVDNCGGRH